MPSSRTPVRACPIPSPSPSTAAVSELAQQRVRISELETAAARAELERSQSEEERPEDEREPGAQQPPPPSEQEASLASQLAEATTERDRLAADRQNLCQEILSLNSELAAARGRLTDSQGIIDGLNDSVEVLVAEIDELKAQIPQVHAQDALPEDKEETALEVPPLESATENTLAIDNTNNTPDPALEQRQAWTERLTGLEEENQLLRHCLNEAEAAAAARHARVEELELLDAAQKRVVAGLKASGEAVASLASLRSEALSELAAHKEGVEASFGQVASTLERVRDESAERDAALAAAVAQKEAAEAAYAQLSDYYTQIQTAYTGLYTEYTQLQATQASPGQASLDQASELSLAETQTHQLGPGQCELELTETTTHQLAPVPRREAETGTEQPQLTLAVSETETTQLPPTPAGEEPESRLTMMDAATMTTEPASGEPDSSDAKRLQLRLKAKIRKLQLELEEARASLAAPATPDNFLPVVLGLKGALADLQTERNGLDEDLAALRAGMEGEMAGVRGELAGFAQHVGHIGAGGAGRKRLASLESEKAALEETVRLQAEELASIKAMWYAIEGQRSSLEADCQALRLSLDQAQAPSPGLPSQDGATQTEEAGDSLAGLLEENGLLAGQLTELAEANAALQGELAEVAKPSPQQPASLASSEKISDESSSLREENAALASQITELAEANDAFKAELCSAREATIELRAALEAQGEELERCRALAAQLEAEAAELRRGGAGVPEDPGAEDEAAALRAQVEQLTTALGEAEARLSHSLAECKELKAEEERRQVGSRLLYDLDWGRLSYWRRRWRKQRPAWGRPRLAQPTSNASWRRRPMSWRPSETSSFRFPIPITQTLPNTASSPRLCRLKWQPSHARRPNLPPCPPWKRVWPGRRRGRAWQRKPWGPWRPGWRSWRRRGGRWRWSWRRRRRR